MTAAQEGFSMPAEWSQQCATWLSWPVDDPRHWGGEKREAIWGKFAEIAATISRYQKVRINAPASIHGAIAAACNKSRADPSHIRFYDHPNNDVWCRDHGPIFVKNTVTEEIAVTDWDFNAWGGKFKPWNLDNAIPERVADSLHFQRYEGGMILEGGAIEVNGCGQLITTESVLLNPNRNPHLSREQIEEKLRANLGVKEILWLEKGIEGDDTDGHIDDLARFTEEDTIIACEELDTSSPNHSPLKDNLARLQEFQTPSGRPYQLSRIHLPQACEIPGWRLPVLPASYVNFLIINHAVLVPTFRQPKNDEKALSIISEHFPDRKIIPIDCLDLVQEGGSLHCISQQQPE
ncbi:MAG: agmatine/peptidylarginine deiminase [Akkermansiaceae bacterium]